MAGWGLGPCTCSFAALPLSTGNFGVRRSWGKHGRVVLWFGESSLLLSPQGPRGLLLGREGSGRLRPWAPRIPAGAKRPRVSGPPSPVEGNKVWSDWERPGGCRARGSLFFFEFCVDFLNFLLSISLFPRSPAQRPSCAGST